MGRLPRRRFAGHRARRGLAAIRFRARPFPVDVALELQRETGLSRPVAVTLARRGVGTPAEAEAFFAADERHDPMEFEGMAEVATGVLEAIRSGDRITIYGDFDCDGVCATAILVSAIRELGGDCDWFIPDRISEGYGLNAEALRTIAGRGTSMVITVDCGVTAVDEVSLARELGMEIIVTDHHQAGPVLPDCQILHPVVCGYPFTSLCGAAVAAKLASALRRQAAETVPERDEEDLDLVALATVTDVMPLTGENRRLVGEGVRVARRARRVGLAALMSDAKIEPSRLISEDFGFRIGPRINAAGRMYRADAGVELFLAGSSERASEIARELAGANAERRRVEREVESEAKAKLKASGDTGPVVVVAGEGWHPGVIGIVASKLVRAEGRPAVVIALDGEEGRGSARSVPGLDLHAALGETKELLEAYGGHAAAAGLSVRADRIDEFREALGRAVEARIGKEPADRSVEFDAIAGGPDLGLDLAEEIERLQPFGNSNPPVKLLVPGATIEDLQEMGEGKHCRFTIRSGSHRARGVCFGRSSLGVGEGERVDVLAELGVNHWNGSVEPQLRVEEVRTLENAEPLDSCGESEWWERFEVALTRGYGHPAGQDGIDLVLSTGPEGLPGAVIAELIGSGERIVVLTADARQRWAALGGNSLARFLPDRVSADSAPGQDLTEPGDRGVSDNRVAGIWAGSPRSAIASALDVQVLVTDFDCLDQPFGLGAATFRSAGFDRVALLDPPFTAEAVSQLVGPSLPVHLLSGTDEFAFAARCAAHRLDMTNQLRALFRGFRDSGAIDGAELEGEPLRTLLAKDEKRSRSPEEAARLLRVLLETGLARSGGAGSARHAGVVSSKKTDLSVSAVFVHHFELQKEQDRFFSHFNRQTQKP